jgi:hypothetical protein
MLVPDWVLRATEEDPTIVIRISSDANNSPGKKNDWLLVESIDLFSAVKALWFSATATSFLKILDTDVEIPAINTVKNPLRL